MKRTDEERAEMVLEILKTFEIKPTNKILTEFEKIVPSIKHVHRNFSKDKKQRRLI